MEGRVLIIEDNQRNRKLLRRRFVKEGLDVGEAATGAEGIGDDPRTKAGSRSLHYFDASRQIINRNRMKRRESDELSIAPVGIADRLSAFRQMAHDFNRNRQELNARFGQLHWISVAIYQRKSDPAL